MTHSNVRFMCVALYVWCRRPKTGRASLFFFFCYNSSAAGVATSQLAFSSDQDISFGFGETLFSCLLWVWGWWPLSHFDGQSQCVAHHTAIATVDSFCCGKLGITFVAVLFRWLHCWWGILICRVSSAWASLQCFQSQMQDRFHVVYMHCFRANLKSVGVLALIIFQWGPVIGRMNSSPI